MRKCSNFEICSLYLNFLKVVSNLYSNKLCVIIQIMNKKLPIILEIFVGIALCISYLWGIEVHDSVTDFLTQKVIGDCITNRVFLTGIDTNSDYKEIKELISTIYDTYGMTYDIFISSCFKEGIFYLKLDRFDNQEPIFSPIQSGTGISSGITLEELITKRHLFAFEIHLAPKSGITPTLSGEFLPPSQNLYGSLPADACDWLKNVPWYLIQKGVDYVKSKDNDAKLGTWEAYLMAAIWQAEGAKLDTAFGIKNPDDDYNAFDRAEACAATIHNNINRFWTHLEDIKNKPEVAELFGRALVATAALQLYRAGENLFKYFRGNVLKNLAPDYLDLLNKGKEKDVNNVDARFNYAKFLLKFIPKDFDTDSNYKKVAEYFLDKFQSSSLADRFLIFATFFLPYEGMGYSSGYCPIWDMRWKKIKDKKKDKNDNLWIGPYKGRNGNFELNSNWGVNVYNKLNYLLNEKLPVPVATTVISYFLSRKYF